MKFSKVIVVLALLSSLGCGTKPADRLKTDTGSLSSKSIQLTELSGEPVDLSKYQGKVIFINIWATWCTPCVREMPSIERVRQRFDGSQIEFLLASNESPEQIRDFVNEAFGNMHIVRLENFEELGVPAMPTTFIFDESGELVFSETGFRLWDDQASVNLLSGIIAD